MAARSHALPFLPPVVNAAALAAALLFGAALPARADTTGFQLQDGDRVVLLGNTLIEREQKYGYWETLLTTRWPNRHVTFRNLGWSGDTVFGHARARFGTPADGFKHLKEHVLGLKPTVIILGYGLNESFEGESFLPGFLTGLNGLLDTLAASDGPWEERVDRMYLSLLNRPPTDAERAKFVEFLGRDGQPQERLRDAIWALITCSEFRFNH